MSTATIYALVGIIITLCILLSFALHTLHLLTRLHFRELVTTRYQYTRIISEQRDEIRSLTESYLHDTNRTYIPPSPPVGQGKRDPDSIPPSPSPFRMKPNPPLVRMVNK